MECIDDATWWDCWLWSFKTSVIPSSRCFDGMEESILLDKFIKKLAVQNRATKEHSVSFQGEQNFEMRRSWNQMLKWVVWAIYKKYRKSAVQYPFRQFAGDTVFGADDGIKMCPVVSGV